MKLTFEYESRALVFNDGEFDVKRYPINGNWERLVGVSWESLSIYDSEEYEKEYQRLRDSGECPDMSEW